DLQHVVAIPLERDLLAVLRVLQLDERILADEVVLLPADVEAVAELERIDVVVLDVVADEAAAQRADGLVAVGAEPVAVVLQHAVAAVDARQRGRNPARLERVRRVRAAADETQVHADVARGLLDRRLDVVLVGVRAPDLETGRARHAVTQRLHAARADVDPVDVEELDVGDLRAVDLIEDLVRVRTLDLEAIV